MDPSSLIKGLIGCAHELDQHYLALSERRSQTYRRLCLPHLVWSQGVIESCFDMLDPNMCGCSGPDRDCFRDLRNFYNTPSRRSFTCGLHLRPDLRLELRCFMSRQYVLGPKIWLIFITNCFPTSSWFFNQLIISKSPFNNNLLLRLVEGCDTTNFQAKPSRNVAGHRSRDFISHSGTVQSPSSQILGLTERLRCLPSSRNSTHQRHICPHRTYRRNPEKQHH